ncbi:RNA-binding protein pno1-like [Hylaeus volcanicus]|uniref:RNA-binding protein pno1-like n=1 Tax=Hylaeus volcanicus TaxID=313075 RepID=UPI0023B831F8|nr:RNA-binding protein pno1-like [Hylaeus volcanicus]
MENTSKSFQKDDTNKVCKTSKSIDKHKKEVEKSTMYSKDGMLTPTMVMRLNPDVVLPHAQAEDECMNSDDENSQKSNDNRSEDKQEKQFGALDMRESTQGVQKGVNTNKMSSSLIRRLVVPAHRLSPLRKNWENIVKPLVEHMKLLVRMNVKRRCVELKMSSKTPEVSYLQKGADFVRSFLLGFDIQDGLVLLRLDDLFLESFEIKDVKRLVGDNLSRCIGRISGKEGKTKFAIENATRTRIVLADTHIHILGAFQNIKMARDSICALILGSPPGKVYNRLRTISRRLQERF